MAIYPQRLTIYLYNAHRAVIFAIAQLSCLSISQRVTSYPSYPSYLGYTDIILTLLCILLST